ncbi:hypothetical protein HT031_001264 [Scenedesmus sp. PABB004]|nr:hypothetical protein HT031_001264 [Scenedesmus sp. PABB004]
MGRVRKSLVQKLLRAVDTPQFEMPKAWAVFSRYRTAELFLKHPAPPVVRYNDAAAYAALQKQHPTVKLEPLRINSRQPSLARRFVDQQNAATRAALADARRGEGVAAGDDGADPAQRLALARAAFADVEERMRPELHAAGRESAAGGYLEFIQEQEEEALRGALKKLQDQQAAAAAS